MIVIESHASSTTNTPSLPQMWPTGGAPKCTSSSLCDARKLAKPVRSFVEKFAIPEPLSTRSPTSMIRPTANVLPTK